jgi:hypothetical protein
MTQQFDDAAADECMTEEGCPNEAVVAEAAERKWPAKAAVEFDYPREGETISGPGCTFRISALRGAEGVDIRINEGPWLSCGRWFGSWYHRWPGAGSGRVKAKARMRTKDGLVETASPLGFRV